MAVLEELLKKTGKFVFILFSYGLLYGASIETSLQRPEIYEDEATILEIAVEGERNASITNIPSSKDIEIQPAGQSRSFSFGTGGSSSSLIFRFRIVPLSNGVFTIPSITVETGDGVYESEPLKLTVLKGSNPAAKNSAPVRDPFDMFFEDLREPERRKPLIMAEKSISRDIVYAGESVILRYYIAAENDIDVLPEAVFNNRWDGFILKPFDENLPQTPYNFSGRNLKRYHVVSYRLVPTVSGNYNLTNDNISFIYSDGAARFSPRMRGSLPFNAEELDVLPLPLEGRPQEFSGNIGRFDIDLVSDKNETFVGNEAIIIFSVSGRGEMSQLSPPTINDNAAFRIVFDSRDDKYRFVNGQEEGSVNFKYILIPNSEGNYTLDEIAFNFFDPDSGQYTELKTDPLEFVVKPAPAMIASGDEQNQVIENKPGILMYIGIAILILCVIASLVFVFYRELSLNRIHRGEKPKKKPGLNENPIAPLPDVKELAGLYIMRIDNAFSGKDSSLCFKELLTAVNFILREKDLPAEGMADVTKIRDYMVSSRYGGGELDFHLLLDIKKKIVAYLK